MLTGDVKDRVPMGVADDNCDTGAKNLELDWLDDSTKYKCLEAEHWNGLPSKNDVRVKCDNVPKDHSPKHFCMNETISYDSKVVKK